MAKSSTLPPPPPQQGQQGQQSQVGQQLLQHNLLGDGVRLRKVGEPEEQAKQPTRIELKPILQPIDKLTASIKYAGKTAFPGDDVWFWKKRFGDKLIPYPAKLVRPSMDDEHYWSVFIMDEATAYTTPKVIFSERPGENVWTWPMKEEAGKETEKQTLLKPPNGMK